MRRLLRSIVLPLFPLLLLFAAVLAGVSLVEDGRRQQEWQWYLLEHRCTFDRAEVSENPVLSIDIYRCRGGEEIRRTVTGEVVAVTTTTATAAR